MSTITYDRVSADGINIFYRSAGPKNAPVILLLHGFPTSSHQYRNLIPILSAKYHVVAPDLPGFGFTEVPTTRDYTYNFTNISATIEAFLDALKISKFAVYIFDYGAPTALRLALRRPEAITAIITQNGNAYIEGLSQEAWAPVQQYWTSGLEQDRETLRSILVSFEGTKWQYETGSKGTVDPASYTLDWALMSKTENQEIQLDLFKDYQTNVALYPQFQQYFRDSQVPLLAVWGKNDPLFIPPGAEAFKKDLPNALIKFVDGGHFALETNITEIGDEILEFLGKNGI